jgi:anti-sigma regulatory factor (Ser/Thr protein kinase)
MVDQMLGPTPTGDAARLVVSELVANAVEHARGRIELEIRVGATVLIGVRDHSPDMPYVEHDHLLADRGRGMRLVEAVSRRWWVDREPDAKVVWCEIGLPTTC